MLCPLGNHRDRSGDSWDRVHTYSVEARRSEIATNVDGLRHYHRGTERKRERDFSDFGGFFSLQCCIEENSCCPCCTSKSVRTPIQLREKSHMHTCNGSSSVSTVNSFVKTAAKICACTEDWDVTLACVAQVAYVSLQRSR